MIPNKISDFFILDYHCLCKKLFLYLLYPPPQKSQVFFEKNLNFFIKFISFSKINNKKTRVYLAFQFIIIHFLI